MDNIFGERLKDSRKHLDMTQQDLAEKLGVTSASISSWESGSRKPDFETLDKLCDIFCVTMDFLLGRSDFNEYYFNKQNNMEVDIIEGDAGRCETMVAQFLSLDYYGRGAVEDLIKSELIRCKAQNTTKDPNDYQIVVRSAKKKVSVK